MEYEKLIARYNKGKRNIFIAITGFSIIGYAIDYLIFSQKYSNVQKFYHILSLFACLYSLVIVLTKPKKSIEIYFNLVAYTAIINILYSHIFYHSFYAQLAGGASNVLSRDLFFMLCYLALTGFISNRKHIILQCAFIVLLISYYQWILQDNFFIENAPVFILASIGFSFVMFFFTSVVEISLEKLNSSNIELKEANHELVVKSEELAKTLNVLKETQNQLISSEKMASLGVLAAGVAHEINNPLNFIQGGVYCIEKYLNDNLDDHIKELEPIMSGIKLGINRTTDIVTSLNHFSRQGNSLNDNCDIHSIIESCLTILQNQMKYKIEIVKNYSDKTYSILGNEGKLHQVFLNILSNSCQAIEDKGSISITTDIEKSNFAIFIRDNGTGISEENLLKVSDPFFTTKEAGKGVGLGLSIVYSIIKEHKGTIEYDSEYGHWTEVTIKLPIKN